MNFDKLSELSYGELKDMGKTLELSIPKSKVQLIENIVSCLKKYERYKRDHIDCYKKIKQMGEQGKEGTTFLVELDNGLQYAMKTFKPQKSITTLSREADLQKRGALEGISPNVIDVDLIGKSIVMEKLDKHLVDVMKKSKCLSTNYQKQIISIYIKLDSAGVFHGDANLLNYMLKDNKLYIIDYGMSREITPLLIKKLGTSTPNLSIMTLGMVLKLRTMGFSKSSYEYLLSKLCPSQVEKFGLNK
jgi:predicted Ser/Thr protein kinase